MEGQLVTHSDTPREIKLNSGVKGQFLAVKSPRKTYLRSLGELGLAIIGPYGLVGKECHSFKFFINSIYYYLLLKNSILLLLKIFYRYVFCVFEFMFF